MRTFFNTLRLTCECSADVHAYIETTSDSTAHYSLAVGCWACDRIMMRVPAMQVWTGASADEARMMWLPRQPLRRSS